MAIKPNEDRITYGVRLAVVLVTKAREQGGKEVWTYFIQEEDNGPIKVGIAQNPAHRLAALQCGNPTELTLRAAFKAPASFERYVHEYFADERMVGEWFVNCDELEALADALRSFTVRETRYGPEEENWIWDMRKQELGQ